MATITVSRSALPACAEPPSEERPSPRRARARSSMNDATHHRTRPEVAEPAPASLSDRVRSLRLPDRPAAAPASRLPWVLCALLLCSTAYFALEATAPVDEALLQKLVEERAAGAAPGGGE